MVTGLTVPLDSLIASPHLRPCGLSSSGVESCDFLPQTIRLSLGNSTLYHARLPAGLTRYATYGSSLWELVTSGELTGPKILLLN